MRAVIVPRAFGCVMFAENDSTAQAVWARATPHSTILGGERGATSHCSYLLEVRILRSDFVVRCSGTSYKLAPGSLFNLEPRHAFMSPGQLEQWQRTYCGNAL